MIFDDETLMAYVDGELDGETRRAIEAAIATDVEIADRVARHRSLRAELGAAFGGMLDEPVPKRLLDAANAATADRTVIDLAAARTAKQGSGARRRWAWPEWIAIAASVLLGVYVGRTMLQTPTALVAVNEGRIVAAGSLAKALTEQPSGVQSPGSDIAIAATFRSTAGEYCRAFQANAPEPVAGFACREAGEWRVQTLTKVDVKQSSDAYRMAGATLPAPVVQAIESTIEGDAFDRQQEDEARERSWR